MAYKIEWTSKAMKAFTRLDREHQRKVMDTVAALGIDPRPHGHKKLEPKSAEMYSTRAGYRHRVLYEVRDALNLVTILDVGPREGFYGGGR